MIAFICLLAMYIVLFGQNFLTFIEELPFGFILGKLFPPLFALLALPMVYVANVFRIAREYFLKTKGNLQ
ncbi:MAG: hypothetical protein MPJ24_01925 [Pirellulaceae bacterium]|nr:hypothetical protein [Pirellulaceae bacterium]